MALFGYSPEEEAKEIVTEVKESRGTFVVLFLAGLSAYVLRDRITDWWESRKDYDEEDWI